MEWLQFIQEARSWISPFPLRVGNVVVFDDDCQTWHDALIVQACFCHELPHNEHLRNPQQLKQWLITVAQADVGVLGKQLKTIANEIRHYASQWSVFCYSEFKAYCHCDLFGVFYAPVKDYIESFLESPTAETLSVLLQWGCFLTRITLEAAFTPSFDEFLAVEERLKALVPDGWWDALRDVLRPVALRYQPTETDFRPDFSNGANSNSPRQLGVWSKVRYGLSFNERQKYLLWKMGWTIQDLPFNEDTRETCQLVFVPKGIDSQRLICEEPAANMFLQQGVKDDVYDWFRTDRILRRSINLEDQDKQRERARQASVTLTSATLDLSSASDSVSWRLVEYVFAETELLEELRLTRTEEVQTRDGDRISLEKFAPMGSALCFPTECLIFYGICVLACRTVGVAPTVGVYGDDLVVPLAAEELTVTLLNHFGFQVNEKKSFFSYERFKESCGGEYFDGISVEPLYVGRKFRTYVSHDSYRRHPEALYQLTDMVNSLYQRGYHMARRFVIASLILPEYPDCFFSDTAEEGIFSPTPTNFHLKSRWNSDYQRWEVRACRMRDNGDLISDDDVRYLIALLKLNKTRRSSLLFPEDRIDVVLRTQQLVLSWQWRSAVVLED